MIRCTGIENPWTKRVCKIGRGITGLGNKSNGGRFGGMSKAKNSFFFFFFLSIKSNVLRKKEPRFQGVHRRCTKGNHSGGERQQNNELQKNLPAEKPTPT